MLKTINLSIFILIGFFCSPIFAQKTIQLAPKESKVLTNSSLWTLNATCTIHKSGNSVNKSKVKISVLKNKGTVNGKNLSSGQVTFVPVKDNSSISVSADSGTEIHLINLGNEQLQAICYT